MLMIFHLSASINNPSPASTTPLSARAQQLKAPVLEAKKLHQTISSVHVAFPQLCSAPVGRSGPKTGRGGENQHLLGRRESWR